MKTLIKNLFGLPALIAGLGLMMLVSPVRAQVFTVLHSFAATSGANLTNSDGASPFGGLILSTNVLYGTATAGGSWGNGTVFTINTDGTGFMNLYSFTATATNGLGFYTNSDGANSYSGLILSGSTLYGTTSYGGGSGNGTLFAVSTNGTGFRTLHRFTATPSNGLGFYTNSDGANPLAGLILSGNTLYGTAIGGGSWGNGTLFAVNTDGTGFTVLHTFTASSSYPRTNSDGAYPQAGLILSSNTLCGTTATGGSSGTGTVFALNTNGTGFTSLHNFAAAATNGLGFYTNSGGSRPVARLIKSGNALYGTAIQGGSWGNGTVFKVNTDGTGLTTLHNFNHASDAGFPVGGVTLSGNTLYGTASGGGGIPGVSTVFAVNTDGTGFTTLHSFTTNPPPYYTNSDGTIPYAELTLSTDTLYGTAYWGGTLNHGTVFSISLGPSLTLIPSGPYVILSWPTNYGDFTLQSTTNLISPTVWTTVSPGPVVVGGQNVVINTVSGTQKFFRLIQ